MALVIVSIAAVMCWKGNTHWRYAAVIGSLFGMLGLTVPFALAPIEKVWMAFGEKMSVVMTFVLLTLTYFLVMSPLGLLIRLLGKDLLSIKIDRSAKSYWVPVEKDGPGSRHYLPY